MLVMTLLAEQSQKLDAIALPIFGLLRYHF